MRRASTALALCAIAILTGAALPASASATGEPIARFTCSAPGLVCEPCPVHCTSPTGAVAPGVAVAFDGRVSSDDRVGEFPGTIVSWQWNFGDGATASGAQVSHAFAAPGTYPVTITVTDDEGKIDAKALQIVVSGTPPPPPPPQPGDYSAAVLADAPVSYWRLNEASGTTAANALGGGPAGRYSGAFTLGAPGIAGDNAVTLGANGYVNVTHAAALDTADNFTLEAWIKRNTINASAGLFAKGTKSYQLYIDAANKLILRQTGIGEITRSTTTLTDKTSFHHIAVTKNAATVRLYIDGVDRTATIVNRTLINTTADLVIGAASGYLNGTLDDVAIYNRALTPTAIANHHATGTTTPPPPPPPPPPIAVAVAVAAGTYYVDATPEGVSCETADARSAEQAQQIETPWCSLQPAVSRAGGDTTILVRAGFYPQLRIADRNQHAGTIAIKGYGSEKPAITGLDVKNSRGLRFEGLKITDVSLLGATAESAGNSDVALIGNEFTPHGIIGDGATRFTVVGNDFHDLNMAHLAGDDCAPGGSTTTCKLPTTYAGEHIHVSSGTSGSCGATQYKLLAVYPRCGSGFRGSGLTDVTFRENRFTNIPADGIQVTNASTLTIERNVFRGVRAFVDPNEHPDAFQAFGANREIVVRDNVFDNVDGSHSIIIQPGATATADNVRIENNLFVGAFAMNLLNIDRLVVDHNTAWDTLIALGLRYSDDVGFGRYPAVKSIVTNNVLQQVENQPATATKSSSASGFGQLHHNLIGSGLRDGIGGLNDPATTPLFVDPLPAGRDYRLAPGSPGIGAAADGKDIGRVVPAAG